MVEVKEGTGLPICAARGEVWELEDGEEAEGESVDELVVSESLLEDGRSSISDCGLRDEERGFACTRSWGPWSGELWMESGEEHSKSEVAKVLPSACPSSRERPLAIRFR